MTKIFLNRDGSRRRFIRSAGATVALASTGLSIPHIARAAGPVKIGLIHPATGWAAYPAAQLRYGAQMAIADINAAGGIKSMGGAPLEALLGDSQTKPEIGAAEVEKMNEAGVHALQGCYQSAVGLAASSPVSVRSWLEHQHIPCVAAPASLSPPLSLSLARVRALCLSLGGSL